MTNELVKQAVVQIEESGVNHLIALALDKGANPVTLEKLMDLQERWEANKARRSYVLAITAFKQEAPAVMLKCDKVDFTTAKGRTSYKYANLGSIVQEITALLSKYNLSASWETSQTEKGDIVVICHITHSGGHRESVTLRGPADESGNKNRIQAIGSTVTYLQRYTLLAALGLATGEDDDGRGGVSPQSSKKPPTAPPQAKQFDNLVEHQKKNEAKVFGVGIKEIIERQPAGKRKFLAWEIIDENGIVYNTSKEAFKNVAKSAIDGGIKCIIKNKEDQYNSIDTIDLLMDKPLIAEEDFNEFIKDIPTPELGGDL